MLRSLKGIEFSNLFNCAMEDIRLKQHALEVRRVWELVMRDPHLKRLGDWLVNEEEETQAEKWRLERKFLRTPWIWDLKIILVKSPHYDVTVPFVEVVNIKGKSHEGCPFSRMESRQEKEGSLCASGKKEIPGMGKEVTDTGSAVPFRPWEEREKGGRLERIFSWKVLPVVPPVKEGGDDGKGGEDAETGKEKKENPDQGKVKNQYKGLPKAVLKVLRQKQKGSKTNKMPKERNEDCGKPFTKDFPSEASLEWKVTLAAKKKQMEAHGVESASRLARSGWKPNPCPHYGGSPESAEEQPGAQVFKYEHPNTSYAVEVIVTGAGPQCPGCGETKVQLVRHMKTDKKCSEGFKEKVDFVSFDAQLKLFRNKLAVRKTKAKRKQENEEEFLEKKRVGERDRKAKRKQDDEEEFLEENRQAVKKTKAKQRQQNEKEFLDRQKQDKRKSRAQKKVEEKGEDGRAKKFLRAIMLADIFVCSSCERELFEQNVTKIDGLEEKVEKKKPGLFRKCIPRLKPEALVKLDIDGKVTAHHYICHACKDHMLKKGKMPPMCAENGLYKMPIVGPEMKLTELERNMIARRIVFQKLLVKPKTRWTGMFDKVVNIPVAPESVTNTLTMLPKTPDEAGLIEVTLKRKLEYKNDHIRGQLVDPKKLYKMLDHLKESGNPYYQFYRDMNTFTEKLEEEERQLQVTLQNEGEEDIVDIGDEESPQNEQKEEEDEEKEYREKDVVKKNQADVYGKSLALAAQYPEIDRGDEYNAVTIAPGEGEKPKNVLLDKDVDVQAFPDLNSPDGRYGLHEKRDVRLTDQNFFVQTICNMERKFARTPSYVYFAVAYVELKQIMRNLNMQGRRGREVIGEDGKRTLHWDDAFCVLDNVKQTPRYWLKARYEMYADIDNLGGFQCFWTLSCADLRWEETISKALRDEGLELRYSTDGFQNEEELEGVRGHVEVKSLASGVWMSLPEFLEQDANKSRHEYVRENVLSLTRCFNQRVKAFIREIVMAKDSPMRVYKYSYKTEFQNRGAAHVHGVLWMDMEKLEKTGFEGLKEAYAQLRKEEGVTQKHVNVLAKFVDAMTTVSLCPAEVGELVASRAKETQNHHHTKKACRKNGAPKCRFGKPHFPSDKTLIAVPERMWSVKDSEGEYTLHSDDVAELNFEMPEEEDNPDKLTARQLLHLKFEEVLKKVKDVLENDVALEAIWEKVPNKGDTVEEYEQNRALRIKELLAVAGVDETMYYGALQHSKKGVKIVQKRDLDEIMIESYNPEWLKNWNGNISMLICGDFFGVITYCTEYFVKDETNTMQAIQDVIRSRPDDNTRERMKTIADVFMRTRQIGESEGFYKLLPDLLLKNSNITKVWVSLDDPAEKVKRMRRADDEEVKEANDIYKKIDGVEGLWSEQADLMSKWLRRENMVSEEEREEYADAGDISLAQFAKMYTSSSSGEDKQRDEYQGQNPQHADIFPEDDEAPRER